MSEAAKVDRQIASTNRIVLLVFAGMALLILAAVVTRHFYGMNAMPFLEMSWGRLIFGVIFAVLAGLVVLLNIWLSWIVPWLYKREHGSMDDFHGSSPLPVIAGFFVAFAGVLLPPSQAVGFVLLILFAIDPAGLPALFHTTIRYGID